MEKYATKWPLPVYIIYRLWSPPPPPPPLKVSLSFINGDCHSSRRWIYTNHELVDLDPQPLTLSTSPTLLAVLPLNWWLCGEMLNCYIIDRDGISPPPPLSTPLTPEGVGETKLIFGIKWLYMPEPLWTTPPPVHISEYYWESVTIFSDFSGQILLVLNMKSNGTRKVQVILDNVQQESDWRFYWKDSKQN